MPLPELLSLFREIVREEMSTSNAEAEEVLISPKEVLGLFQPKISRGTLYLWVKDGRIPYYTIGGKKVFKRTEILKAAKELKRYGK